MNELNLNNCNLTELTESDLSGLCHLNNIKPENLIKIDLSGNNIINLDFIQENTPFIRLRILNLSWNKITDINNLKYLINLIYLGLNNLKLKDEKETVKILKNMYKLKDLYLYNTFKKYTYEQLEKELLNIEIKAF